MISVTVTSNVDAEFLKLMALVDQIGGIFLEEIGYRVRRELAHKTPIRTGRAAASWNAALNTPNLHAKTSSYNNPDRAPYDGQINLKGARGVDIVYVTNNVPYIERLNSGSSKKVPAGFVEAATYSVIQPENIYNLVRSIRRTLKQRGLGG